MTGRFRAEAPTWAALALCYGVYAALTLTAPHAPFGVAYIGLAVVIAFHSSLQHEMIHGHPTRWPLINEALVFAPLGLSFPYRRYRDLHLSHHQDARLTDPYDDPESWYLDPAAWARLPAPMRRLLIANNSALGRMAIGPAISILRFLLSEARLAAAGCGDVIVAWALHLIGAAMVVAWLIHAGVSPLPYAAACYAGLSLINLRSFLEHRAEERVRGRSAIVEDSGPLALLYLNNNLHAVHHAHPELPWWALPARYRAHRDRFLEMNGGYVFPSYWAVLARHGLAPKEPPAHPLMPGAPAPASAPEPR
ncbi:MAG: fatty acid desaturase [Pseudomonadota bacterium]